jgi:polyisoprenoid-binding protein YceI
VGFHDTRQTAPADQHQPPREAAGSRAAATLTSGGFRMSLRRTRFAATIVAAALLGFSAAAQAAPSTWTIDPGHSNVSFSIRHFFTKVSGNFTKFSGAIVYDPANAANSSAKAEIDASSINTANERRDGHLKGADFFDVEKFPTLTFESTKVTPVGDKLKIEGNLTMHGVTKPVTLEGAFIGSGPQKAGFEASGKLDRKDFGIIWNKVADQGGAMLGDDVEIRIAIEANSEAAEAERKAATAARKAAEKAEKKSEANVTK